MPKSVPPEDLSVEELRNLLIQKRRSTRQERLEHFRRTGRVVTLVSDMDTPALGNLRTLPTEQESDPDNLEPAPRSRGRRLLDAGLLVVEIGAALLLVLMLFISAQALSESNKKVAADLVLPTLTPTPLIMEVVLPSGHTPPDSPGGTKPNENEIPEWLRPQVQSLARIPIPTAGPNQAQRLLIAGINVEAPVVLGDGWDQLKKGVGQHVGSANPGEKGNLVLTAHDDVFGEIFRDLDKLKQGDLVVVYTGQRSYTYVITGTRIVEPTQVDVMAPTPQATITLITCYPYLKDNKRIIVSGSLQTGNR